MTNKEDRLYDKDESHDGSLKVMFTGDLHLGPAYNDAGLFDKEILSACRQNHYVVVNVEGPITSSPPTPIPGFVLHSCSEAAKVLDAFGNNIFCLANNHILDHGIPGLRDTILHAESRGWTCIGAGESLASASASKIIQHGNFSLGLLAICGKGVPFASATSPGVFGDKPEHNVKRLIREVKRQVRWLVVVYHGGEEWTHVPMPARRRKLLRYLEYGADIVVAHHAHTVQRYEQVGNKYVFYGLGNLVFDLEHHWQVKDTDESVLLSISFSNEGISFTPIFTKQDRAGHTVKKIEHNRHFTAIDKKSYSLEWEKETAPRVKSYWHAGHEGLSCQGWKQSLYYIWRKTRRVAGWTLSLGNSLQRPIIVGGVKHYVRLLLSKIHFRSKQDT